MMTLEELFGLKIKPADDKIYRSIKKHWDSISKPIDGLGDIEEVICRIGAVKGTINPTLTNKYCVVMCADNGITEEGVTQTDSSVTASVATMIGAGIGTSNILSASTGARCIGVDVGIDSDRHIDGIIDKKVRRGTNNFLKAYAISETDALLAINAGIETVKNLSADGADIIACGEMGIGNTTTSAALLSLVLDCTPTEVVGRGAGLTEVGLSEKIRVVSEACRIYKDDGDIDIRLNAFKRLCQVGGLDIAAMCGVFLGGAIYRIPVVIDGLISAVAALLSEMMVPGCQTVMLPSHEGREKGVMIILDELSLTPIIRGNMALGEGTGAILLFPILDAALALYEKGVTFSDVGIDEYERFA